MERVVDYDAMGRRINQSRREQGITQEQLAEMASISTSFVGHIERGEKTPSLETIVKIADSLGLSLDYLMLGKPFACAADSCPVLEDLRLFIYNHANGMP